MFYVRLLLIPLLLFIIFCFYREVQSQQELINFVIKENSLLTKNCQAL